MGIFDSFLPQNMPGGSNYKSDKNAGGANADIPEMDKKTAEEILGFDSNAEYTQADMTERYHQRVADDIANGADAEHMGKVDHAKAFLDSYFVEDPNAVLIAEDELEGFAYVPKKTEPQGPGLSEMAFDSFFDSMEASIGQFDPEPLDEVYRKAKNGAEFKCGREVADIPELSGNYPLWYQAVSVFVRHFPWRFAFAVAVLLIGMPWVTEGSGSEGGMFDILGWGFGVMFKFIFLAAIIIVNSIWGIATNTIRYGLKAAFDWLLQARVDAIAMSSVKRQIAVADAKAKTTDIEVGA